MFNEINEMIWFENNKNWEETIHKKCKKLMQLCNEGRSKKMLDKELTADDMKRLPYYLIDYFYEKYEENMENELYNGFQCFINMTETNAKQMLTKQC